jgi:hypothetical protein
VHDRRQCAANSPPGSAAGGFIQAEETSAISKPNAAVPGSRTSAPSGDAVEDKASSLDDIEAAGTHRPWLVAGCINAWSWSPTDLVESVDSLPGQITVVVADHCFDLFARS